MTTPLDYQTPQPKPRTPRGPLISMLMILAGCGALLIGGAAAVFALVELCESQTNPNFSWGPGAYVFNMLESFVYWALILVPTGVALVMAGARRRRAARGA